MCFPWAGRLSRYSDWLRAERFGDRIPVGARLSSPVQTGPRAHPASCKMGTESFPGVMSGRGVTLTPHPLLLPWSWKSRAIPLHPLWAVRPVQSCRACSRVHFKKRNISQQIPFVILHTKMWVKDWKQKAQERKQWKEIIEQAKTHKVKEEFYMRCCVDT
jgi:hypothetical protein